MVSRKPIREIEKNLVDGGAQLLSEFESLADLGVDSPKQVVCIHFKEKDRYAFYMQTGRKMKSFSVPTSFIDKSRVLSSQVLEHIKANNLYYELSEESKLKVPVLARTTSSVLKNFQGSQYPVVSSYARYFSETFTDEQRRLLSKWFLQESFYEEGIERLDLKLNNNSDYFKEKAETLAKLMGSGTWYFKELNYFETGSKCTLGHDIKWEFLAEEETSKEQLRFGVDCVQDFFDVEGQLQNQLVRFRTRYFNEMLTYSYSYSQQLGYQKNFGYALPVLWEVLVSKGLFKQTSVINHLLNFVQGFNELKLPLPVSLRIKLLEELDKQRVAVVKRNLLDSTFGAVSLFYVYSFLGDLVPEISSQFKENGAWSSVKSSLVSEHGLLLPVKELLLHILDFGFFSEVSSFYTAQENYGQLVKETFASCQSEDDFRFAFNKLTWFKDIQELKAETPRFLANPFNPKEGKPVGFGESHLTGLADPLKIDLVHIEKFYAGVLDPRVSLEDLMLVYNKFVAAYKAQKSS